MLDVAREYVLDSLNGPPALCAKSPIDTTAELPPGFDPVCLGVDGPVPEWMKRCYELAGEFDHEWPDLFDYHLGYAWNLHNGTWGDWSFANRVDLSQLTAAEMWLLLQTRPLHRKGKAPRAHRDLQGWQADVDPDAAASAAENHMEALSDIAYGLLDDLDSPLTIEASWDILLVVLLLMDPNFEPDAAGVRGMPPWALGTHGNWLRARCFPMLVWQDRSSNIELLCELAYRAGRSIDPGVLPPGVSPLTDAQVGELLRQQIGRAEFAHAVLEVVRRQMPPAAWTRGRLCEITGVSAKTFTRIRGHTTLPRLKHGQRDIVYGPPEVQAMAIAARKKAPGKRDWFDFADKIEAELRRCGFLAD